MGQCKSYAHRYHLYFKDARRNLLRDTHVYLRVPYKYDNYGHHYAATYGLYHREVSYAFTCVYCYRSCSAHFISFKKGSIPVPWPLCVLRILSCFFGIIFVENSYIYLTLYYNIVVYNYRF